MRVTLVIPLRDEEGSVDTLLDSVVAQTRPPDEVVIVDAGSLDSTAAKLRSFGDRLPLVVLSEGPLHPGEARNRGVAAARHDWIAFTDGGVRLEPTWLETLTEAAHGPAEVVFGAFQPVCDTAFRQAAAIAFVSPRSEDGKPAPSVASLLLTRAAFQKAGGFPPFRAAEDLVFFEALEAIDVERAFAPRALVHWQIPDSLGATYRHFALYSEHNLKAGRGRFWHRGLARLYGIVGAAVAVGLGTGAVYAMAIVALFFLARAARSAWRKRGVFAFQPFTLRRILGAAIVLVVLDVAALAGTIRWFGARIAGR